MSALFSFKVSLPGKTLTINAPADEPAMATVDGVSVLKTGTYSVSGTNQTAYITLPAGTALYYNGTKYTGTAQVGSGGTFYITAPAATNATVTFNVSGKTTVDELYLMSNGTNQSLVFATYMSPSTSFAVEFVGKADLQIKKSTAAGYESWVAGNSCYSLAGAQYTVYTDAACTTVAKDVNNVNAVFTTAADGTSGKIGLVAGTYYIKETKAPKGYLLDGTEFYLVTLSPGDNETLEVSDEPTEDPLTIGVTKKDAQNTTAVVGATFEIKHYGDIYTKAELAGKTPLKTWIIKTDAGGKIDLRTMTAGRLEPGSDALYPVDPTTGNPAYPMGTYTVQEVSPAPDYERKGSMQLVNNGTVLDDVDITDDNASNGLLLFTVIQPAEGGPAVVSATGIQTENLKIDISDEQPYLGGFAIQKVDADRNTAAVQGNATDFTATYELYNLNDFDVEINGRLIEHRNINENPDSPVYTFTTNADGEYMSAADFLHFGKYRIVEKTANTGYTASDIRGGVTVREFEITDNGDVHVFGDSDFINRAEAYYGADADVIPHENGYLENPVARGGFAVQKNDAESDDNVPQGDGSLAATFEVYNHSNHSVIINGVEYPSGTDNTDANRCFTFVTDTDGRYFSAPDLLPYGTYEIVETVPPEGYLGTSDRNSLINQTFTITAESDYWTFGPESLETEAGTRYPASTIKHTGITAFKNAVIRGGFTVIKKDMETGEAVPQGSANLEGTYNIVNRSDSYVWVDTNENGTFEDSEKYGAGEVVFTFKTDAETGEYTSSDTLLPYGTYEVVEVTPPEGYLLMGEPDGQQLFFEIRNEGETVTGGWFIKNGVRNEGTLSIYNYVMRGDFYMVKKDGHTSRVMPYIPFRITMLDSEGNPVESHIVYTDENGVFSTSTDYVLHTYMTNDGDNAVLNDETGLYESDCRGRVGTWFGGGTPADSLRLDKTGALPYGKYLIEELPCEANVGYDLFSSEFTIANEISPTTVETNPNGYMFGQTAGMVDYGTVYNWSDGLPAIITQALVRDVESHYAAPDSDMVIVDTVSYWNLSKGKTYTLHASLVDAGTLEAVTDEYGEPVTSEKTFTVPENSNGAGSVRVELDMDSTGWEGKTVVVYEELYDENGVFTAAHMDSLDTEQQIHFPDISTVLVSDVTGTHLAKTEKGATLTDTITYTNLEPGRKYKINGYLIDKDTKTYAVDDNGDRITATASFRPVTPDGETSLTYEFDAETLKGKTFVAFEELIINGNTIALHMDINDGNQTVMFPEIGTTAVNAETGLHVAEAGGRMTITDTVAYRNLIAGDDYVLNTVLMDRNTGEPVTDADGNPVTIEKTFTAEASEGTVDVTITFDSTGMDGHSLVVFEKLFTGNGITELTDHEDINDEGQSVHLTRVATTAVNKADGTGYVEVSDEVTISDTVRYENLIPGETYTVKGVLMDKETREPVVSEGKTVTAEAGFIPETADGAVVIDFTFKAGDTTGQTVVFEKLFYGETQIGSHEDYDDEDQTVSIIKIGTTAYDKNSGINVSKEGSTIFTDRVYYEGLTAGEEYVLSGKLMDKKTGESLKSDKEEGPVESLISSITGKSNEYISEIKFVPEKPNGYVEVSFDIDTEKLDGKSIVVFEKLYFETSLIAKHEDINDEGQTIHVPEICTTAYSGDGSKSVAYGESVTVSDRVEFKNLVPGKEYIIRGTLMDKETGKPVVVSEYTGTGDTATSAGALIKDDVPSGQGPLKYSQLTHDSVHLSWKGYADWLKEEYGWTVRLYKLQKKGDAEARSFGSDVTDIDITGLDSDTGYSYTLTAVCTDKRGMDVTSEGVVCTFTTLKEETEDKTQPTPAVTTGTAGEDVNVEDGAEEGRTVTAEARFTPETADGFVIIEFVFDSRMLAGKNLVVFEKLFYGQTEIADHEDIDDEDQTVSVPKIGTEATVDGKHTASRSENTVLIDKVQYKNLTVGKEYTVTGVLMDKKTGKPLNSKATAKFVPEKPDGTVEVKFEFNSTNVDEVVVFEDLYLGDTLIAVHADINDEAQLVTFDTDSPPTKNPPSTGRDSLGMVLLGIMMFGSAALGIVIGRNRRKRKFLR